jgi:hypothetical protein
MAKAAAAAYIPVGRTEWSLRFMSSSSATGSSLRETASRNTPFNSMVLRAA